MVGRELQVGVRQRPHAAVVDLHGEIHSFGENVLRQAYSDAEAWDPEVVLLNFEDVDYINSTGIGLLVTLLIRINRQKQKLLTCGLSEHYVHIFELTRLNEAIGMYETEAAALAAAGAA